MNDFREKCQTSLRVKVCMSLLFSKQLTKREFLESFFVKQGLSKFSALPDHNYSGCHKTLIK